MNNDKLSRRRLLGGLLAALTAWLYPRPRRVAAAPHRPSWTADPWPSQFRHVATYNYDGLGRLVSERHPPPRPVEPPSHGVHVTREQGDNFTYSYL